MFQGSCPPFVAWVQSIPPCHQLADRRDLMGLFPVKRELAPQRDIAQPREPPILSVLGRYAIQWDEPAHVCEGYKPQFVDHTPERKERWEAEREETRESRRQLKAVTCSVCGEILECPEDAEWHWEQHEGKPEREHYAIDGEPDGDLDGYEDEPEEDYCEGHDDGYDCD